MIEKKTCVVCNEDIVIINCHYTCNVCGFSENCHDKPHLIDEKKTNKNQVKAMPNYVVCCFSLGVHRVSLIFIVFQIFSLLLTAFGGFRLHLH